ncbi:MAG: SUKH-4 family immunity protein [Fluviicoccus sp.]|uniref:SUKH-4 family immunity protein n=1 Tax=Fluviicoccus sp. TaxID=2003552 RepID=UPI00272794DB|nr:SUKH-4 family immunity protein [Fluviicoccus sp.]MDO8330675.1 SUKH-4 family immunity protein [Fluviicoccus sp.]
MVTSFAERWANKERELGFEGIASQMVQFGSDILPSDAAPCLTFNAAATPLPIHEVFGSPTDWSSAERERFSQSMVIGSDGAGNPFCVEKATESVWLFDHDDRFRTQQFVNCSVGQLAECLLAYMGEDGPDNFQSAVTGIDPKAIIPGTFWWQETKGLAQG